MRERWLLGSLVLCATAAAAKDETDQHVAVGMEVPSFSYEISRKPTATDSSDSSVRFSPKVPVAATVEVAAFGLSVGTSFDLTEDDESEEATTKEAKTEYSNYNLSYYFDRIGVSGSYVTLKGMNMVSATGVDASTLETDPEAHRPDIKLTNESADLWLAPLSFNFSLKNFFDPATKDSGCGLGLVVVGSYDDLEEKGVRQLIPEKFAAPYGNDAGFMGGHFTSLSLMTGPALVLSWHGLYLSGLFEAGEGRQTAVYRNIKEGELSERRNSTKTAFFFSTGYKGSTFFSNVSYSYESPQYDMRSVSLSTTQEAVSFVVGSRF